MLLTALISYQHQENSNGSFIHRDTSTQYTMRHTVYRSIKRQKLSIAYVLPVTCSNMARARGSNWVLVKGIFTIYIRYFFSTRAFLCQTCLPIWSCLNERMHQLMWLHMYIIDGLLCYDAPATVLLQLELKMSLFSPLQVWIAISTYSLCHKSIYFLHKTKMMDGLLL